MRALLIATTLILSSCAQFQEVKGKAQQLHYERLMEAEWVICTGTSVGVIIDHYRGHLEAWEAFCERMLVDEPIAAEPEIVEQELQ